MIANIAAVVLILALTFVAVYSIIKSYRKAKVTGNPSCVGCCSCNHSEEVCPRFNNINFDKK